MGHCQRVTHQKDQKDRNWKKSNPKILWFEERSFSASTWGLLYLTLDLIRLDYSRLAWVARTG